MALVFPHLSPTAINIGPLAIRWYALAYVIGIFFSLFFIKKTTNFPQKVIDKLMLYSVIGIILGGRLGYIIFYNLDYYINNLDEVFKIWNGGMAFHGALIGLIIALKIFCHQNSVKLFYLLDRVACSTPVGLLLGRIANFINGELYGKVTDVYWGVIFPTGGRLPRHPSQLYEALTEGLISGMILNYLFFFTQVKEKNGVNFSIGLILYAIFRSFIEIFREPDKQVGYLFNYITMGQILSSVMFIVGIILLINRQKEY